MLNIAVLVSGGGTNLQALLDSEARGENPNGKIRLVVASKPGVYALERAANAGVEGVVVRRKDYASSEDFDAALLKTLKEHHIDLVVLAGFLSVLGPSVIEAYPRRILNIHPALIPSFCGPGMYGLRPHEAALARGCKVTGATVHFVNEECDGGPILLQKAVDILPGDTPEVLQKRVVVRRKDYASSEDFDAALLKTLKEHHIDLVVLAGFLSVLGPSVIEAYPRRILNIHPALIPSFCGPGMYGLRPHEAALARGCKVTGATVHFVNEECDGGPILLQKAVDILPGDTPEVLQKRVMEQAEWKLLPKAVAMVCSGEIK